LTSSLTATELENGLNLNNSGSLISGIMQNIPASSDFSVWAFQHQRGTPNGSQESFGMFLGGDLVDNPTTSDILLVSTYFYSSGCSVIIVGYWDYYNGTYTELYRNSEIFDLVPPGLFFRIRYAYEYGDYYVDYSTDGSFWTQICSGAFLAKQVGLFAGPSPIGKGVFSFFRATNSVDTLQIMYGNR
jgi:hypothetical protein